MKQKLIVLSADALTFEDMEYLKTLPNYRKYLEGGCRVKRVRSVYPTITYPCHTTMVTGVWPEKHGVLSNMELIPGASPVPWKWFYSSVSWKEDLFTAAKRAGLTTAAIFWPVTGGHPAIDYLIDEYWPQPGDENMRHVFARAGSSEEVLDIIEEQFHGIRIRTHPQTDDFIMRCAREFILRYQPDLLMLHPANIDAYRHNYGLFNDQVTKGVEETDRYIGELMEAVEEAGLSDCTNLALVSDHGQIDIKRIVSPNVLLAEAGLIETDGDGKLRDWKAYCQSGGTQALVYLKDPNDRDVYDKTYKLLRRLEEEGSMGLKRFIRRRRSADRSIWEAVSPSPWRRTALLPSESRLRGRWCHRSGSRITGTGKRLTDICRIKDRSRYFRRRDRLSGRMWFSNGRIWWTRLLRSPGRLGSS